MSRQSTRTRGWVLLVMVPALAVAVLTLPGLAGDLPAVPAVPAAPAGAAAVATPAASEVVSVDPDQWEETAGRRLPIRRPPPPRKPVVVKPPAPVTIRSATFSSALVGTTDVKHSSAIRR